MIKKIFPAAIFAVVGSLSLLGLTNCYAADQNKSAANANSESVLTTDSNDAETTNQPGMSSCSMMHDKMMLMHRMKGAEADMLMSHMWDIGMMQPKNLSADDAKIIAQAALLIYNRKDLQVGDISTKTFHNHTFYIIKINDTKGNVVTTVAMNKDTGFIRPIPKFLQENIQQNPTS